MPRVKLSDELKKAIQCLSDKEKNKLLMRLIPSNDVLVDQLIFELLEHSETTEERRQEVSGTILLHADKYTARYYSPLTLLRVMRKMSSVLTRHVRVTKDKIGEIELNIQMLSAFLIPNRNNLKSESIFEMGKLSKYAITRLLKIQKLLDKVHDDYRLEYEDQINELHKMIKSINAFKEEAANQGYDVFI